MEMSGRWCGRSSLFGGLVAWRARGLAVAALLLAVAGSGVSLASAAGRVALVIGNSEYEHSTRLRNPGNDAAAIRDALTRLGFEVVFRLDADEDVMDDALAEFERRSERADVALVFYAGHGMEMGGVNYLVPVDARLASSAAVTRETIPLGDVLNAAAGASTRIVILDACRNNPFVRSMRGATRNNVREEGGLAAVAAGAGSLVAYAAAEGEVAADGEGRHSPFTSALLDHIERRGVDVRIMLGDVGASVRERTGRQQPFVYASLGGVHYLNGPPGTETAFWQSIQTNPTVEKYLLYEREFPNGRFAALSRLGRAELEAGSVPTADPPDAVVPDAGSGRARAVGEVFHDCDGCPEMVVVPAGEFMMGSPASEEGRYSDEGPRHRVRIGSPFAVSIHEVTFAEWDACASAGGCGRMLRSEAMSLGLESSACAPNGNCGGYRPWDEWGRGSLPVINVSWDDAQSYVTWLAGRTGASYRLLSEAEWEYVARAGTTTRYWWGDAVGRNRANCFDCGSRWDGEQTAPGGSFETNAFGLHDVSGNVSEWVEDCWSRNYLAAPSDGAAWTTGDDYDCDSRVLRGGSWLDDSMDVRSAARSREARDSRIYDVGFRVARTLD